MRFDGLKVSGLGPFRDPVELDLAGIDGTLLALCGENGAGKTCLVELLAAGLYREMPTRGSLASLATSRDASLEVRFTNGKPWTLRHNIDKVSGGGDSVVLDASGAPALTSAKRRDFDAWAAKHLPSKEVLFSSVFTPQGASGFLDLKPGDRKAVVLRVLGIEKLEALAEAARAHAREARTEVAKLTAQIETLGELDVEACRAQLADAEQAAVEAERALYAARERAERARAYADVAARIVPLRARLADLTERRANNAKVLEDADIIRGAADGLEAAKLVFACLERDLAAAAHRSQELRTRESELAAEVAACSRSMPSVESRLRAARLTLEDSARVGEATDRARELRERLEAAELELAEKRAALEQTRSEATRRANGRIGALRGHLSGIVASTRADSKTRAKAGLAEDDTSAALVADAPEQIDRLRVGVVHLDGQVEALRRDLRAEEAVAARAVEMVTAEQDERDLSAELAALVQMRDAKAADLARVVQDRAARQAEATGLAQGLEASRAELERLDRLARRLPHVEGAAARIAEYDPQIAEVRAEFDRLAAVPVEAPCPGVAEAAETALADARARRERAVVAVERAEQAVVQRDGYAAQLATAQAELADWLRLAEDLGRDGLQATLIQCAAPELNTLANDLLHTCCGPRFTVTVDAARVSADGKRELSGMEVTILDTEKGREGPAETFSGGERVLIAEALSLALTMLACRQSGATGVTLIRDESGAALDPENARAWIRMLRRAADLVGARHVLFVSHNRDTWELADARIVVADGKVEVMS